MKCKPIKYKPIKYKPLKKIAPIIMLFAATYSEAHVEYYDLNQGKQIGDLTAQGKIKSTEQYGETPSAVLALNGPPTANGISTLGISALQDLPLNNMDHWNSTYQTYTGVGKFTNLEYTANSSSATVEVNDVTDFGWADGTQNTLGDSHKVDFFNFRLAKTSQVTISWTVDSEGAFIDAAFSLYKGVLQYQGHDDSVEQLNPYKFGTGKVQNKLDDGTYADAQGISSPLRNTTSGAPTYIGQFNALASWSQTNSAGQWSAIEFLRAVNNKKNELGESASETIESLTITLPAGNYTIGASGALGAVGSEHSTYGLTGLHGKLVFTASAVAEPEPVPNPEPDPASDDDNDGVINESDNCDSISNADQANSDGDDHGDACDLSAKFSSTGTKDGWLLESSESSTKGGKADSSSTLLIVGDSAKNQEYRSILHFDTSSIPDNAIITKATLTLKKQGSKGNVKNLGNLLADLRKKNFGSSASLATSDFQAGEDKKSVASFTSSGNTYTASLNSTGKTWINKTGTTQFRLHFSKDDNNDKGEDYLKFYSGNSSSSNRPAMTIEYYLP